MAAVVVVVRGCYQHRGSGWTLWMSIKTRTKRSVWLRLWLLFMKGIQNKRVKKKIPCTLTLNSVWYSLIYWHYWHTNFSVYLGKNNCSCSGRNVGSKTGKTLFVDVTKCSETLVWDIKKVYELISKPLMWNIFPERTAGVKASVLPPCSSSHLTSSSALWNILKLPKTQPAPAQCVSSRRGLLTRPDADPS